jgi:two-component system nitrogen regulation sensor histidine kinase NtrY
MEEATQEYQTLEEGRTSLQLAFGILYLGFALIVLLSAIWTAIAVADRLVRPIRVLIGASDDVASGNLDVVPCRCTPPMGMLGRWRRPSTT